MAELIDAVRLKTEIDWLLEKKYISSNTMVTMKNVIDGQPTTTEAEIRAKAISDFLQFAYDNASNEEYANEDGWAMSDLIDLEFKFAEQLKEE